MTDNNINNETKNENVRGVLFRWTDESAMWYEEASAYTGYHDRLAEIISPHLDHSYTCCELACGTGTLARHLAPHVKSYIANDIDFHATDHLLKMTADGSVPNLSVMQGDWHEVFAGKSFNAAVFSFFGAVEDDWDDLKQLAEDKIIVISPRSREGKMKAAAEAAKSDKSQRILRGKARSYETGPSISEFLDKNGISYVCEDLDLEFGQPFSNLSQARAYVRYYYKLEERDIDLFLEKKLERTDTGWYFPKNKAISVIIIDMKTAK
jgi:SAM-dependent methyltransferase